MSTQLSAEGLQIEQQSSSPSGVSGSALLYTKGNVVYMNANNGGEVQLTPFDIDQLSALGGANLHETQDHFVVSDNGTEKKILFEDVANSIFANVSGDATIAASGSLTIAADAVHQGMLNDDIISGQAELAHADIADSDELMISDNGTIKRVGVDSLRDHFFGVVSGDATVADGGALTIAANAVQTGMVHDDVATELAQGAGLEASSGQMSVSAAQTSITSIINASLAKIGTNASQEYLTFGTANEVNTFVNNTERLSVTAAGADVTGDLTVSGDLTVNGDLVQQNVSQLVVEDTLIGLGYGASATGSAGDRGLVMGLNGENAVAMIWDESASQFAFARTSTDNKDTAATIAAYAPVKMAAVQATSLSGSSTLNLDGAAQFNGNVTVKAGATLDLTGASLTLDNDELSGDKIEGGTINAITINTLTATAVNSATLSGSSTLNLDGAAQFNGNVTVKNGQSFTSNAVDINGGAIDGTNVTVGSGKTLDVSGGTLTLANDQISGDKVEGGTIAAITINALTAGTIAASSTAGFAGGYGSSGVSINSVGNLLSNGALTVDLSASFGGGYTDGGSGLSISSGGDLDMNGTLAVGSSGEGADVVFYGTNDNDKLSWDASANKALFTDNNVLYLSMGGESGDYAIDVGDGTNANAGNRGKIRAAAFVTYSDRNLKKDIAPMSDALDKVMKLDAVSYKMKNDNRQEIGFIAQDVAKVVPEVCALDANGEGRGIDYSRMTALLAGAMKSQQAQIENLQKVIANLQK